MINLVGVCDYYTLIAMMLETADLHPPNPPSQDVPPLERRQA